MNEKVGSNFQRWGDADAYNKTIGNLHVDGMHLFNIKIKISAPKVISK